MRVLPQVDNNTLSLITWTGNKLNDAANKNPFMSDKSPSFQSDPIWGTVLKANGNYALCSTNQITSPITYDMWLCPLNNVSGDFGNYSYKNDSRFWSTQGYGHENEPWFHVDANNSITFQICDIEKGTTPANTLEPNKWNLYSFEFNSSRYAIYKNGVKLVDKAAVSSTYYGGWIRLFCGASSRLNNCLVGPIRISNICRHGFKNFSIEEWQRTQQEPLSPLPKFISQIRADNSSITGVKDLQGNTWKVFNNAKLTNSPDPFGGNDAIKIDSYDGAGNFLTLEQANAIWSKEIMPNFTLASWVKLDRATNGANGKAGAHLFTINDKTKGYSCCTIVLKENDIGYLTYGTIDPDPMVPAGSNKQWFYLEVSFEDTLMRIFKNGKLLKEATVIRRFKNFHDVYNWLGQYPWDPNYRSNGSTFHIFDFCLIEGVLHKKNYTPPRSYLSFEGLFNKVSASSNSLVIRKNDITSRVPIYSSFRWQEGNPDHKIGFYIPNTGIYSAVFGNTKQCIFHRNWIDGHNNVQSSALADVFGSRNVLRFDSSKGTNSFMNLAENIGRSYSFECFFKFADNKNSNWIVGATTVNIVVNYVNNEYNLSWHLNSQNSSVPGGSGSWYVTPNQWHHLYFQYIGGMKFKIALDGVWSKDEMTTLKPEDNTWLLIGGWDDDSRRSNKISKSVIDMSYIFVYKTNNPPYNTFQSNFSRPMHAPSVKILNGRNVEYGMTPLLQDIQKSPIYFSIAGGKYGIDPTADLANFEKANKIFHITNENGYVYDITCKTDWTSTNITPESNLIGAPLRTCTNGQYGMLVKNSGPDIVIGLDDFTFLIDIKIYGPKNISTAAGEEYKKRYYLIDGDLNALESSISEDMKWMNLGYAGNHPGNEWATITGLDLKYGQEYRIIEQRKNGIVDVWINGRHVYQGKLLIDMSGKVKYVAAPEAAASMNLNGSIRNAVLWNKAVISMPGGGAAEIDELRKRKEEKNKTFGICFHHDVQEIKESKEGTIGEWKRIDINGNDLSFSNMSERWPFNAIKEVVVDGQKMIRIPKIYVRNTVLPSSSKYAGERQWSISNKKIDSNWHVHPAFMHNGKEYQYVDIAKYIASKGPDGKPCSVDVKDTEFWADISFDDAHNTAEKRNVKNGFPEQNGWHMYNIYEHHLLARLMLIEYGTSDLQTVMTGKKDGMNATYHGITNVWGYFSTWQNYRRIWLDGLLLRLGGGFSRNGEAWGCYIFQAMDYKNPGGHYIDIAEYNFPQGGDASTYLMNPLNGISNSVDRGDIFLEDYDSDVWYNRGHDDLRKRIDFHGVQDVSEWLSPMPLEKISAYCTAPRDTRLGLEMGGPFTLMRHLLYYHGADHKTAFRLAHYVE